MNRRLRISLCSIVALAAVASILYYLIEAQVPVVLFFIPLGKITLEDQPALFWSIVAAHAVVAALALVLGIRFAWGRNDEAPS